MSIEEEEAVEFVLSATNLNEQANIGERRESQAKRHIGRARDRVCVHAALGDGGCEERDE